ncbi:MAG: hypothetical protein ACKOCD_03825 [Nitrospiraceae bacterium]
MISLERLEGITVLGIQTRPKEAAYVLCNDPETGTTFAVHPGETIGEALERVESRYSEAMKGHHGGDCRIRR